MVKITRVDGATFSLQKKKQYVMSHAKLKIVCVLNVSNYTNNEKNVKNIQVQCIYLSPNIRALFNFYSIELIFRLFVIENYYRQKS